MVDFTMMGLTFHHFGLAVRQSHDAVIFLTAMGYRMGEPVFDENQNVRLMIGSHDTEPPVEIIYEGEDTGPIDKLLQRHAQGIIYHICYVTENLAGSLDRLEAAGLRVVCVSPPKPALLFKGRKVSFYNIVGIGLIEILE